MRAAVLRPLAGVLLLAGCHSIRPHLDHWAEVTPTRCVVVVPATRAGSPGLAGWCAARRAQGYQVSLVTFDPSAALSERSAALRRGLAEQAPAPGQHAYALILADEAALPMGPWLVEGLDRTVESDLPWFFGQAPTPEDTWIQEAEWRAAFAPEFPWLVGRIPSLDEGVWAAALAPEPPVRSAAPLALLGSEQYLLWGDTAWVMARARAVLHCRGWRALSASEDWPGDLRLGSLDAADRRRADAALDQACRQCGPAGGCGFTTDWLADAWHPERLVFLAAWLHLAPEVVYLNSHGSGLFGTTVGEYLLSEQRVVQLQEALAPRGLPRAPARPALLVVGACRAGSADDTLIPLLFQEGWVSGVIASTENTNPRPLGAALQAEVDLVRALQPGLTAGRALRACLESYLCDARGSASWWLRPSTAPVAARNVLGISLFGDPTRPIPAVRAYNQRP